MHRGLIGRVLAAALIVGVAIIARALIVTGGKPTAVSPGHGHSVVALRDVR